MNARKLVPVLLAIPLTLTSLACPTRPAPGYAGGGGATAGDGGGSAGLSGKAGTHGGVEGDAGGSAGTAGTGSMGASAGAGGGLGGGSGAGGDTGTGASGAGTTGNAGKNGGGGTMGGAGTGANVGGKGGAGGSPGMGGGGGGGGRAGGVLGETCHANAECTGGHCVLGVCCDQACTGSCEQCSASGHCQMPADDPTCGAIACPADTECRDYATSITTNRCKALGACKTAPDCTYVSAPTTKVCDSYQGMSEFGEFCDGAGNCVGPTVSCGGDGQCPLYDMVCCGTGQGYSCLPAAASGRCDGSYSAFYCDETSDCEPGYICCADDTPGGEFSACSAGCAGIQVCNPAVSPSECKTGTCKPALPNLTIPLPDGYYTCQ
jgi:hypothetical protein